MFARATAFLASPAGRALRCVFSLGLLTWLAFIIDWRAFATLGHPFSPGLFFAALLVALATYPLCALRWHQLLRSQNVPLSFANAHRIVWIGQFYNAFLPGGIGGDAARLAHAFTAIPSAKAAIATATVLDRLLGFIALILVALFILVLFNHSSEHALIELHPSALLLTIIALLALASLVLFRWLPARLPSRWTSALHNASRDHRTLLAATGLSMAVWILDFFSGWLLARSLGLPIDFLTLSLALTAAYLSTLLPISLGGHGLREGTLVLALAQITGTSHDSAGFASLGFLFLIVTLLCSAAGGIALLLPKTPKKIGS